MKLFCHNCVGTGADPETMDSCPDCRDGVHDTDLEELNAAIAWMAEVTADLRGAHARDLVLSAAQTAAVFKVGVR